MFFPLCVREITSFIRMQGQTKSTLISPDMVSHKIRVFRNIDCFKCQLSQSLFSLNICIFIACHTATPGSSSWSMLSIHRIFYKSIYSSIKYYLYLFNIIQCINTISMQKSYNKIRLVLTRHGQTEENSTKTLCGQLPGKLTEKGKLQAQKIGDYFASQKYLFYQIYVSDLQRTKDTFVNIKKKAIHLEKIPIKYVQFLRQKHGGVLQGKPLKSWKEGADREKKGIRQYKCKNGQSWEDVNKRCYKFLEILVAEHLLDKCNEKEQKNSQKQVEDMMKQLNIEDKGDNILAVSHGGYIMQFYNLYRQQAKKQNPVFDNSAKNCSIHEFQIKYPVGMKQYKLEQVKIQCLRENYTGHL